MKKPTRIQFKEAPKPAGLEYKQVDARLEVKATGDDGILHIKAYVLAFGNVDSWDDIILPGACDAFLAGPDAKRMALCYQHDFSNVIGKITDKGVDEYGMWIEADVLPTTTGKDAAILLKNGAITEFSIGYKADAWEYQDDNNRRIRRLKAITIYEASPVTIAANPRAVLLDAKADGHSNETTADPEPANPSQTKSNNKMTPDEIKAMRESIEKAVAEKHGAEVKALQDEVKAAKEAADARQKEIDNLDKSMKALQAKADDLADKLQTKEAVTFFSALKSALEAKRDEVKSMLDANKGSMKIQFEVKTELTTGDITNVAYGVALEPGIHAARPAANVFYDAFPKDVVRATQFDWLEGSFTDAADYVAELAAPGDDDAAVVEKSRKFGKIAAHLRVSSEVADFFEEVYNWARNTAQAKIIAKIDTEILSGLGNDTANVSTGASPNKIYGLKANSANYTAFSATGAKYKDATVADVILDAQAQALAKGYSLDKAFVTWALYAQIRGLKDANGHYLFNEVTGLLNGVQILPTAKLSSGEILVVESDIVRIKERPVWELEIVRNASLDGWDVYVRKAAQTLVKANDAYGVIYVASVATAIAAITEASPAAATAAVLTDVHDSTNKALKTKAVTE